MIDCTTQFYIKTIINNHMNYYIHILWNVQVFMILLWRNVHNDCMMMSSIISCWFNVGLASQTMSQHWTNAGWLFSWCNVQYDFPYLCWLLFYCISPTIGARCLTAHGYKELCIFSKAALFLFAHLLQGQLVSVSRNVHTRCVPVADPEGGAALPPPPPFRVTKTKKRSYFWRNMV